MSQSRHDKEFVEKIRTLGGYVKDGTPHFGRRTATDMQVLHEGNESITELCRDRTIFKTITQGNPSDKSMKHDAEVIQRTLDKKKKDALKRPRLERISKLKTRFKQKYGISTDHFNLRGKERRVA